MGSEMENRLYNWRWPCSAKFVLSGVSRFNIRCLIPGIVGLIMHSSPVPYLKWQNVLNYLNSVVGVSKRNVSILCVCKRVPVVDSG
jgi:hypothetical protein